MKQLLLAAAALILVAGCTPLETSKNDQPREEREYITGSNLPKRDRGMGSGVVTVKPEDFENSRNNATGSSAPRTGG